MLLFIEFINSLLNNFVTGYDASTDKIEDMISVGIVDPAKVTRVALQNAASIAGLMLTTEAMITDAPDDNKSSAPDMGGMGGMGGMM